MSQDTGRTALYAYVPRLQPGTDDADGQPDAMEIPFAESFQKCIEDNGGQAGSRHPNQTLMERRGCAQGMCHSTKIPGITGLQRSMDD